MAEASTFALLACPMAVAIFLSRTGRFQVAHILSAVVFTATIVWIAALSDGSASPVLAWLPVIPLAAALSGSARTVAAAAAIAGLGLLGVTVLVPAALGADSAAWWLGPVCVLAAIAYAGWLASGIERPQRGNAAAQDEESHYRLLADNATDLVTRHVANGDVDFASPAVRSILGAPASEIVGDGLSRRVHVADRPAYLMALSQALNLGAPVTVEFRVRRGGWGEGDAGDDRFITVEMRCRPAVDQTGKAKAVIAVTRDVSDRKARESELRAAHEAAERANLAKGSFLAHMSHELRTPLNAIIGFSEILDRSPAGEAEAERRREYAKLIRVSGEHLLEVVNGILDISKLESGMFDISVEPLAVAPILEGCCAMMELQAAERGVSLVRSVGSHLPRIQADLRAVRQIVLNLLSNAIKFTGRGGTVRVEARVEGAMLAVSVSDDGIGISADDIPRLGTPFVQLNSRYERHFEGTGLGLSIVKGLAALHGGNLSINSTVGVGTTVTVTLPLAEGESRDGAAAAPYAALLAGQHKERKRA